MNEPLTRREFLLFYVTKYRQPVLAFLRLMVAVGLAWVFVEFLDNPPEMIGRGWLFLAGLLVAMGLLAWLKRILPAWYLRLPPALGSVLRITGWMLLTLALVGLGLFFWYAYWAGDSIARVILVASLVMSLVKRVGRWRRPDDGGEWSAVQKADAPSAPRRRRECWVAAALLGLLALTFALYFPGPQMSLAISLATGLGIEDVQARVDGLEEKAIGGGTFTAADRAFLHDLYTCFFKGARMTVVLRQSARMMEHYLSLSGDELKIQPRIFLGSGRVQEQMAKLKREIAQDQQERGVLREEYQTPEFHMGDPEFFESFVGLYYGRLMARPHRLASGQLRIEWRVEMPWQWPSYASLRDEYGDAHAQCFPLPNMRSVLLGARYGLRLDDGLGEHLVQLGLAKPFLVRAAWEENLIVTQTTEGR